MDIQDKFDKYISDGVKLYDLGDYGKSIDSFSAANYVDQNQTPYYWMAKARFKQNDVWRALYNMFLALCYFKSEPNLVSRHDIHSEIEKMEPFMTDKGKIQSWNEFKKDKRFINDETPNKKMAKIKILANQHFDQSLPFGMELMHSKYEELLKLDTGSYEETTDSIILETTDGNKIIAHKNKIREQNNARVAYEGELHFGRQCLIIKIVDTNFVELIDFFYPSNSYRIMMDISN